MSSVESNPEDVVGAVATPTPAEPIPGYVLQQRIGSGGYGEVWKATAPGGLQKAVKVIYGQMDDKRATRELKALSRMKELSHPFLLSLERIEVVDGRLVIVSELADGSLKDRFDECRSANRIGVPRDELVQYVREAGDALDYLYDSHQLQHLDVKPENLLLIGRHVKVADFGLLKDLQDVSTSLLSGYTPKYAAPELFDNRPSRASDQYSLAVVYQEMVTGRLPFDGQSAAKLASQHLHSAPDLSGLTPFERFAVGKALSKDPQRRFRSCQEFVSRLIQRSSAKITTGAEVGPSQPKPQIAVASTSGADDAANDGHTVVVEAPSVEILPPIPPEQVEVQYRPTIFLGLGGTGARVLCRLRQLLNDRFEDVSSVPALRFLLLDTDVNTVNAATSTGSLRQDEALVLPVRNTWDYRNKELSRLRSISRRWIYNVPKSMRTEGLRALGRIALLDHAQRVLDRLRSAIHAATDHESIAASCKQSGLDFQDGDPRVYIVSSLAGGTGGGMLVDVAYAVRQILAESGLCDEQVCGLLTYSTRHQRKGPALEAANALATLEELRHFSLPHTCYPGEPAVGLYGFEEEKPTFAQTYLLDAGDELSDEQFDVAIDRLATYLALGSTSPAVGFLDAVRRPSGDAQGQPLSLRTMGLCPLDSDSRQLKPEWVEILCKSVVRNWRGGLETAVDEDRVQVVDYHALAEKYQHIKADDQRHRQMAQQCAGELGLDGDALIDSVCGILNQNLRGDAEAHLNKIAADCLDRAGTENESPGVAVSAALQQLRSIFGLEEDASIPQGFEVETLRETLFAKVTDHGRAIGEKLKVQSLAMVEAPQARVTGARRVVSYLSDHLQAIQSDLRGRIMQAEIDFENFAEELSNQVSSKRRPQRDALVKGLCQYVQKLCNHLLLDAACRSVLVIEPYIKTCSDQLRDLWNDLNRLSEQFDSGENWQQSSEDLESDDAFVVSMSEIFREHQLEMISQLDRDIELEFFSERRRLLHVLTRGNQLRAEFIGRMRATARRVILQFAKTTAVARLNTILTGGSSDTLIGSLRRCSDSAMPNLLAAGGASRLLLVAPEGGQTEQIRAALGRISGHDPSLAPDETCGIIACYEAECIPWEGVTARFIRSQPNCDELASRLHTRIDIDW